MPRGSLPIIAIVFVEPDILERRHVPSNLASDDGGIPGADDEAAIPYPSTEGEDGRPEDGPHGEARTPHDEAANPVEDDGEEDQYGEGHKRVEDALVLCGDDEQTVHEWLEERQKGVEGPLALEDGMALEDLEG